MLASLPWCSILNLEFIAAAGQSHIREVGPAAHTPPDKLSVKIVYLYIWQKQTARPSSSHPSETLFVEIQIPAHTL